MSSSRTGVSLKGVEQPPGSLVDIFPPFSRFEAELSTLGQDALATRSATLARMSAAELIASYESARERLRYIRSTMAELSSEQQLVSREMSETMMILSLHRFFDLRRVPPGTLLSVSEMPDDGRVAPMNGLQDGR